LCVDQEMSGDWTTRAYIGGIYFAGRVP